MTPALPLPDLRARVQASLDAHLLQQRSVLEPLGVDPLPLLEAIGGLLRGGKRLRAAFLYRAYQAAGGTHTDPAVRAAASLELFQAAALLHDDVMDGSDTRRNAPTAHRFFADEHARSGWLGVSDKFGEASAILAGDLCLVWTDELFATCGWPVPELARARVEFDRMRSQLMAGQFLDVLTAARGWDGVPAEQRIAQARKVIRFKSAKYSIEQPLLIGASAADASPADLRRLSAFGLDLGEAFQLRDDLLGVYGDPSVTGKPAGDDLREGKLTLLIAYAAEALPDSTALLATLGRDDLSPSRIEELRELITATGAVARVERDIDALVASADAHLAQARGLSDEGLCGLRELAVAATARQS